jgi:methyl-accepting chemotaxis protein
MISFKRMRVSARLVVAGVAVFIGLTLISGYTLVQIRRDALTAHSERIKHLVEVSKGVIGNYQKLEAQKILSREDAQQLAKEALRSPRFGADDYFFIYDYDGRALMVAGKPSIEGEVMLGKTDAAGFKLWEALVAAGKAGSGYFDYVFPRAGGTESQPKRGYVMGIPEWKWIVGTGVYIDDVNKAVNEAALRYGALSLLVLTALATISLFVSRSVISQLGGEPHDAAESMRKIANGDLGVEIVLAKDDNSSLMASLKVMQMKLKNITSAIQENATEMADKVRGFDAAATAYTETRTEEDMANLQRAVKKMGKTADILEKSISRFKL